MHSMNVLTWNSGGETEYGAEGLRNVIGQLALEGWLADAIVIQEAKQGADSRGPIREMLSGLGGPYNAEPAHAEEGGPYGRGYLLLTRANIDGQATFGQVDLAQDPAVQHLVSLLHWSVRDSAINALKEMRMPAMAVLSVPGVTVNFLTWHAPLGPSTVMQVGTLPGRANPDAYLFLQHSQLYRSLVHPGPGNLGVVAGDLNVTRDGLQQPTGFIDLPHILPGFVGVSSHLDHIVAHTQHGYPRLLDGLYGSREIPGHQHAVLYGTVSW
jgi:hypothetical protein